MKGMGHAMIDRTPKRRLFDLGQLVATPGALSALEEAGLAPADLVVRHAVGDWGDLTEEDHHLNDAAVHDGSRILSAYRICTGVRVWIITEAIDDTGHRAATTILLPDEY